MSRATICLINHRTADLTQLCLRAIRKYTRYPYDVVVVDNNSADESLDYLRSLDWITLIKRGEDTPEQGAPAHATALDLALGQCGNEYFISMHTDTIVYREGWLRMLALPTDNDERVACVGSGKLEMRSRWRAWLKDVSDRACAMLKRKQQTPAKRYYNRTICCLYRTRVLHDEGLTFYSDKTTAGEQLYYDLDDRGYKTIALPPSQMMRYMMHLSHATMVINPQFNVRSRAVTNYQRNHKRAMAMPEVRAVLNDASLDH